MNIEDETQDIQDNSETKGIQTNKAGIDANSKVNEIKPEQQEVMEFKEILSCSTKEISILVQEFNRLSDATDKNLKNSLSELKTQIKDLHTEVFVLRKLPGQTQESLKSIVPEIARELDRLHREILKTFNDNIQVCNDNLNKLSVNSLKLIEQNRNASNSAMDELIIKSRELSSNYIKKFFANAVLITVIATMVSLGTSYYTIQKIPSKVMINEASGQMHIQKSDVSIWGSDYKVKERMKYKKD